MSPYRVVLTHSEALFRDGLREILQKIPGLEVVGAASDGHELPQVLKGLAPDLIIVDIVPPIMNGLMAVQQIKKNNPRIKIVALSPYRDIPNLLQAFKYGADGYLLKDDPLSELIKAVEAMRNDGTYISPFFPQEMAGDQGVKPAVGPESRARRPLLSARQREILELIAEGRQNREIAKGLHLSPRTIEYYRSCIKKKLNLKGRGDLIRYALENKFLDREYG